jgi:hypothetical protein
VNLATPKFADCSQNNYYQYSPSYVDIESLGARGGVGTTRSFEAWFMANTLSSARARRLNLSGPNTPLNKQINNMMPEKNDFDGFFFEVWTVDGLASRCEVALNIFVPGQWVHVLVTVSGAGTTIYESGVQQAVCPDMPTIPEGFGEKAKRHVDRSDIARFPLEGASTAKN